MKLYLETSHSEFSRTTAVELFCGNKERVKAVSFFRRRTPSWMFDRILNPTPSKNLLRLEEGLRSFPLLGLHKEILDSPYLIILLI